MRRLDLHAVAASVDTLVVLMGMARLEEIVQEIVCVRPPETPAAAIMWGTTKNQESVRGTLLNLVARVRARGLAAPSVVVVGDVVCLGNLTSLREPPRNLSYRRGNSMAR